MKNTAYFRMEMDLSPLGSSFPLPWPPELLGQKECGDFAFTVGRNCAAFFKDFYTLSDIR